MAYLTLNEARGYLGITEDEDNALLQDTIDAAALWLDDELNRVLVAESDTTIYVDAVGPHIDGKMLYIGDVSDLCAITTVTNGDSVEVTSGQYTTYPKTVTKQEPLITRIKILDSVNVDWTYSTDWENAIQILGRVGMFSATNDLVKQMMRVLVGYAYHLKDANVFETVSIPEAGVIAVPQGFPVTVARFVRRWRKI